MGMSQEELNMQKLTEKAKADTAVNAVSETTESAKETKDE